MKFIKQFSSESDMNASISQIKHGDGAFLYYYNQSVKIIDQRHPGPYCPDVYKVYPVNMNPVKLDSSSTKKTPAVADILYSTSDGKLTLDAQTNGSNNTAIAICVIPEVMENFKNGDDSTGAIKTARFVSLNYMDYDTPTTGNEEDDYPGIFFGNYDVTIGNTAGGTDKTSYVGGKLNTQKCLDACNNENSDLTNGVTNSEEPGYCAPACCCIAYSTLGTKPGDWYLPMPGELYQIYANKAAINEKREAIKGSGFSMFDNVWSSRECNSTSEYICYFYSGFVQSIEKEDETTSTLAFLALEV